MVGIGMMVVFSVHVCGAPGFLTGMVGGGMRIVLRMSSGWKVLDRQGPGVGDVCPGKY